MRSMDLDQGNKAGDVSRRDFLKLAAVVPLVTVPARETPRVVHGGPDGYSHCLRRFPQVEPFLPLIVDRCRAYQQIFPLEPEVEVAKLYQESGFDPDAISLAGAVGIAQVIPETARDQFGLHVYVSDDYHQGVVYRHNFQEQSRRLESALERNDFDAVKRHKLAADEWSEKSRDAFLVYKRDLQAQIASKTSQEKATFDGRFDPERSFDLSVHYLAQLCRSCALKFKGPYHHNVLRGLAAYNAGPAPVHRFYGLPYIFETVDYVRKIMVIYDELMALAGRRP